LDGRAAVTDPGDWNGLAERIPPRVRFGSSSWTYPDWRGLVYHRTYPRTGAAAAMLAEYARFPLFGTVGIDSTFYRPPEAATLRRYAAELPEGFPCVSKAWDRLTVYDSDHFLDAALFREVMLDPYLEHFAANMGPFVFEFQAVPRAAGVGADVFADRLDQFLGQLPRSGRYAVEVRNPGFLTPAYFAVLREHDVAHVFNSWTRMPSIGQQLELGDSITAPFVVCRALLRPGRTDADARETLAPFDRIRSEEPEVRSDIVRLIKATIRRDGDVFILVNNRLEGCSPLTIAALIEELTAGS
jgi:uncharacterized protein YecE (DUF72 family)